MVAYQHFVANGSTKVDTLDPGAAYTHQVCGQFSTLAAISVIRQYRFQPIFETILSTPASSSSATNGTATVIDSLGEPPYTYHWSNGDSTATISNLSPGTYYMTITDKSFCSKTDSVVVTYTNGISDLSLTNINVYPNPTQGVVVIENKNSSERLSLVEVFDVDGNKVDAPQVQEAGNVKIDLSGEAKGVYTLHIRSASGRELHRKVVLM